jgi:hypothetical protein
MADINQVLSNVQADQATKANAWELFQSSTDQASFTQHLNSLNLPNDAKAQIWEMKFGAGAQSSDAVAAYAKKYDLPLDVAERHMRGVNPNIQVNPDQEEGVLEGLVTGVGKGGAQTLGTVTQAAEKYIPGAKHVPGLSATAEMTRIIDTQPHGAAEWTGAIGENILEFIAGDEALKGLSLAERLGTAAKIAKFAETSPRVAKALEIGMTAVRQGAVGGAQTLAKGGTPTQAAESAGVVTGVSAGFGAFGAGAGALYRSLVAKSPEAIAAAKEAAEKEGTALAQKIAGGNLGTPYEVAQNVGDQLEKASDAMHADYAQGLAQIGEKAQGIPIPIAGSAIQKTAKGLLSDSSIPAEIQTAMKGVVPDSARLEPLLNQFASGSGNYSWEEMEATRKAIGDTIRKLPPDSPLRPDLIHLRGALDSTMSTAAEQSGNPEVAEGMKNLRSAYASKVQAFESNAIKSLADKSPDSVAGALLNKQSVFSVNTLRSIIGADNMRPVEGSLLQRLVDNASTGTEGFNPKTFVGQFNRLGPDVQKAIWGDTLPQVKDFLATAAQVPSGSPIWGGFARYVEHRAIFDVGAGILAGGAIFGAGELSGKRLLGPAALVAGVVALHNPRVMEQTTNAFRLFAAAATPAVSSAMAPEQEQEPEAVPTVQAPITGGATIAQQLSAKRAAAQKTATKPLVLPVARPNAPALPFSPGAGIPR